MTRRPVSRSRRVGCVGLGRRGECVARRRGENGFDSGFALDLLRKDVATALAFSDSDESVMPLAKVVDNVCRNALEHLGADCDRTEIARWLEGRTEVHLG